MRILWNLFASFFQIGLFTFGGGYAMLPMLQKEVVQKHQWSTEEELLDYYAISQCTPGVIAVNVATFVGTKVAGAVAGAVATFAVILPSVIIIGLISALLQNFSSYAVVQHALTGIRVAVCALVVSSVWNIYKRSVKGALANAVFAASLILVVLLGLSPVYIVLAALLLGIVLARRKGSGK